MAFSEEKHSVKQVLNVKNTNKCSLPLFIINQQLEGNSTDMHNISSLLNTKVIIEKPQNIRRSSSQ